MATISLAKALQVKNRLAQRIRECQLQVTTDNSQVLIPGVDNTPRHNDVWKAYNSYVHLQECMVDLKDRISEANRPIQAVIYELAELKGRALMLSELTTKHGKEAASGVFARQLLPDGSMQITEYSAAIQSSNVVDMVRELQNSIDDKQSVLDAHNHQVVIEFDTSWL